MFSVLTAGGVATRSDIFASIEDALRSAEQRIASKRPGQSVKLQNQVTGEVYDEKGIAELRKSLDS